MLCNLQHRTIDRLLSLFGHLLLKLNRELTTTGSAIDAGSVDTLTMYGRNKFKPLVLGIMQL